MANTTPKPWADAAIGVVALALLAWGWHGRADPALDPHGWPGYLLGLGGALMMLLVLAYSLRKRVQRGRWSVGWWYHAHVLLGLFGPVAVLVHARFGWRSINAGFALIAMLLVVGSGLIARYALPWAHRSAHAWARSLTGMWHYLHVPLFIVLGLAVLVHVFMAHAY